MSVQGGGLVGISGPMSFLGVSPVPGPFWRGYVQGGGNTLPYIGLRGGMSRGHSHGTSCGGMSWAPRDMEYNGIRSASRQYASYWNAFLLVFFGLTFKKNDKKSDKNNSGMLLLGFVVVGVSRGYTDYHQGRAIHMADSRIH